MALTIAEINFELDRERYLLLQDVNSLEYLEQVKEDREARIACLIEEKWKLERQRAT